MFVYIFIIFAKKKLKLYQVSDMNNCRILNCVPSSLYSSLCIDEIIDPLKIIFDQLYNKHLTKLAKYLHMTQIRRNLKLACNTCFLEMYGCFARIWIDRSFLRKFGGHFSKKKIVRLEKPQFAMCVQLEKERHFITNFTICQSYFEEYSNHPLNIFLA